MRPRKLKMSHVLDQGDESKFTLKGPRHIAGWFHKYMRKKHPRPTGRRRSPDQRAAFRVNAQLGSLSADFAVSTRYARKTTRARSFTADLASARRDVAGQRVPGSGQLSRMAPVLEVSRVSCLMLRIAHEMPLNREQRKIEKLAVHRPAAQVTAATLRNRPWQRMPCVSAPLFRLAEVWVGRGHSVCS